MKSKRPKSEAVPIVDAIVHRGPSPTDPQGSYTGKPVEADEVPVQDADDL